MADDLDTLDPAPRRVRIRGSEREIRPLVAGVIPALVRTVQPFLQELLEAGDLRVARAGGTADGLAAAAAAASNEVDAVDFVFDLLAKHGERALEAIAIASRVPREDVDELAMDELVALGVAVWEINSDFFTRKLGPLLAARATARSGAGPTPSSC